MYIGTLWSCFTIFVEGIPCRFIVILSSFPLCVPQLSAATVTVYVWPRCALLYEQVAVVMLLLVQLKSLGVTLKVKPSTVSQLPGLSLHSTVKLTPAVNLTPVMVGAGGGAGERETHDTCRWKTTSHEETSHTCTIESYLSKFRNKQLWIYLYIPVSPYLDNNTYITVGALIMRHSKNKYLCDETQE